MHLHPIAITTTNTNFLVNNAGKSYTYPEDFHASTRKDMEDIVTININSVVRLTHMVIPGMVERSVLQRLCQT